MIVRYTPRAVADITAIDNYEGHLARIIEPR